ncbi:MAG: MATE family efflux transporter [Bacteroidales bacterium]|nr:MATE family efflux transporter [Bacteroidales bacterium]
MSDQILRLALPSILANLTVPLVGMVDIAVAGHLDTSAAALIGGISVGSLMFDMMYWNFGFLRAGTGGLTAQAFGRGDWADCAANLKRGVGLALLMSLFLLLVQWPFQKLIFVFVQCSEEVRLLALKYFYIRVWAAPATLSLMALRGWFIGMQDTFSSMLTDVVVNGVNILGSILLALGVPGTSFRGIGYPGIAWGTIMAQYTGLLFAACILLIKYRSCFQAAYTITRCSSQHKAVLSRSEARMDSAVADGAPDDNTPIRHKQIREFFTVNRDLFVRSLCLMAVYLAFTAISARFGDTYLAMCSIMMKIMMIFSYFTDGFAFAGEALTGRFIGAKDRDNLIQTVKWSFIWSMGIGFFFIGLYAVAGIPMFRMMTSDATVVEAAREFIPWLVLIPLLGCPAFTWDGIYIGATATPQLRDSNIGCLLAFMAVWFAGMAILNMTGGAPVASRTKVHLLFAAYYAHLLFRSLYQTLKYRSGILTKI